MDGISPSYPSEAPPQTDKPFGLEAHDRLVALIPRTLHKYGPRLFLASYILDGNQLGRFRVREVHLAVYLTFGDIEEVALFTVNLVKVGIGAVEYADMPFEYLPRSSAVNMIVALVSAARWNKGADH